MGETKEVDNNGGVATWAGPHSLCHFALILMDADQIHTKDSVTT